MLSPHKGMNGVIAVWGEPQDFCPLSSHGPAYNQLFHYVVLTVRTAGFRRNERATGVPKMAARPRKNEYSKPEGEDGQGPEAGEGRAHSLPLGLSASGLEKVSSWGFATEQKLLQG